MLPPPRRTRNACLLDNVVRQCQCDAAQHLDSLGERVHELDLPLVVLV
jgi:hypothetical protein